MRMIDFSNWHAVLSTLASLALITFVGIGFRMLLMMTVQERRQRQNRQINERLRVLIAAYKTLGGSFTGDLFVDPTHLRDYRRRSEDARPPDERTFDAPAGSERGRRIRDAVEGSLSDILLLGTEDQVRLAARALNELVAGRRVHTHDLVISLRDFVRSALDLDPIPASVARELPAQGPTRASSSGGSGSGKGGRERGGGGTAGGGGMGAGGMGGGAAGLGVGQDTE